ncbi:YjjW family glycine radical enzyme activase [Clostridium sp. P21]|uniref:YjjW family glycine radical enzyme activase n=1 Tax=Clostridium muellerianum TaxID=2716538 RepID=A0A7Y0EJQ2_9CLOT|nr:YjjW family glycine radical enzyme activase [Clostridium muellerianum]NMM64738.1 YjjW family glycine radical enzyme activase [Clostridium muellerianum]
MLKGIVRKIIPFSFVDGPGNRAAVFFQGCNFDCLYCHNPETIKGCVQCGTCVDNCPYGAISLNEKSVVWNPEKCEDCGLCVKVCKNHCGPKFRNMTADDILEQILKVKPFISGITVSGGECTLQWKFLVELFKKVKKLGLTIFVDSNGSTDFRQHKELTDLLDMVMLDIKSFDKDEHKMLTGRDNDIVIGNAKYLGSINKLYEIRTVIVPEVLDNYRNVDEISKIIASINPKIRYKLIKYRTIGTRTDKINTQQPTDEMMEQLKTKACNNGCENIVIV